MIHLSYNGELYSYDNKTTTTVSPVTNIPVVIHPYVSIEGAKLYYKQDDVDGIVDISDNTANIPGAYLVTGDLQVALKLASSEMSNFFTIGVTVISSSGDIMDDDIQFTMDNKKRLILVPGHQTLLAIQFDNQSEIVTFKLPRYQEGVDLSTKVPYVNYRRPQVKDLGKALCTIEKTTEDSIYITWMVDATATQYDGVIQFQVEFADSEGYRWQSQIGEIPILASLYNTGLEPYTPDILEQYLGMMQEYSQQAAASAQEGASQVGAIQQKGEEVLASIPSDYTELTEDVDNLRSALDQAIEDFAVPTQEAVDNWLTAHPEATTTVQDGSLTLQKFKSGELPFVTPEQYGAKGDGVTDDSTALLNAINSGACVVIANRYKIGAVIRPSAEAICIIGNGGEIAGAPLVFSNSDVLIHSVTFKNSETNAISLTNCAARIIDCTFSDVGISGSLTPASEGAAVYFSDGEVSVVNCKIEKTHGHASIFGTSADKYLISGNDISSPYYRGIEIYDSSASSGIIANNVIENTGRLLSGNSGVGCNGIYVYPAIAGLSIVGNTIKNCVENGIEAGAGEISNNVIDGTGADASKATQSTEGIFINGDNCIVKGNTIRNAKTSGIRANRSGDISSLVIVENTIVGSGNNSAIDLNSYTSKTIQGVEIVNNTGNGNISFAGANSPQTNLIKNNAQPATRQALNAIKNIKDFSIKSDVTTFDDETTGGFTANNATVTYTDGADGGKIANVAYNQYGRLSKTIKRLPNGLLYGITLTVQGNVTIYAYKGGSYYTNSRAFSSSSDFSDFSFVWETPADIEIRIQGVTGETLLISSIKEYVVDPNA